jgi:hypothetical protein
VWRIRDEQDNYATDELAPFELHQHLQVSGPAKTKRKLNKSTGRRAQGTSERKLAYLTHSQVLVLVN